MTGWRPMHDGFRANRRFGSLDGLRCLSILPVIWHHSLPGPAEGLMGKGAWGVSQFFAISGFLITTLLLRERDSQGVVSMRGFYARRSLRIFPLYYGVLAAFVLYEWLRGSNSHSRAHFFESLAFHATYTSNWFVDYSVAFPIVFAFSWSLATEEQFYLTWPWAIRLSRGPWIPVLVMAVLLAVDQGVERGLLGGVLPWGSDGHRILRSLSAPICLGSLGALLLHYPRGFRAAAFLVGHRVSAPLLLGALILAMALAFDDLLVHGLMALLTLACCMREDHFLAPILRLGPFAHIGRISYGIYLMHVAVVGGVRAAWPAWQQHPWLAYLLAVSGSVLVASVSFRFFEQPILSQQRRLRPQRSRC